MKKALKIIGSVALAVVVGAGIWQVTVHQQSKKYNMITLDTSNLPTPVTTPVKEGKLVISFDWMYNNFPSHRQQIQLKTSSGAGAWNGNLYLAFFDRTSDGEVSVRTLKTVNSWTENTAKIVERQEEQIEQMEQILEHLESEALKKEIEETVKD